MRRVGDLEGVVDKSCPIYNNDSIFQEMNPSNVCMDYQISQNLYKKTQDANPVRSTFSYLHNPHQRYQIWFLKQPYYVLPKVPGYVVTD